NKVLGSVRKEGFSVVPIIIYFNDRGLVKLNIGLGKGKKKFDKRETQKMKDWNKSKQRLLKNS
ncbi:SsrA-binding protein, partial [Alphaproteobacteria bacterium]|nr:SsrA-binding protein [Alphaproteobacteria bacterium]